MAANTTGWFEKLIGTRSGIAALIARVALGVVMFPHGAQKALGWFGGHGLGKTIGFMHERMGIPIVLVLLSVAAEFLGSIGLITGTLTRVAAAGIGVVMIVAVLLVHLQGGFFMNWMGTKAGEGFEYHLLALGLAAVLLIEGGGRASVDGVVAKALEKKRRS